MPSDTNGSEQFSAKYLHVKARAVERARERGETGTRVAVPRTQRLPPGQYLTQKFPVLDLGVQPPFDPDTYRLTINGAVRNPVSLTFDELRDLPSIELTADFHCVTHWSRYDLNWTGVPFETIVDLVDPLPEATHVMQHALEGYKTNNSMEELSHPDVIVAYALDGEPIPREHGAPVRIIAPHLYAWKGAKFLNRIEFMTRDQRGFWEVNGYHNHADPWSEERFSKDE
ncbi:sulfite oxidase-like oxidoreductase [Capsulimonas corticalis]|uniref:Sulfite oxidase-like oxidoreductase n=1 Tax=Capsulimonas corticalis TaxID=2219043 RepID=A0A402CXW0_9BACT|nr:sulfite oxidase-like oxidoreductase [Capsulimonas corticalis]BDI32138.1 sulfite oxidase-like oxidoreductase [Capsulimonas corticalis]